MTKNFTCVTSGVIERWELRQAHKFSDETVIKQDLEQWQKLNSDLCDVTSWLARVLPELERLQQIAPSTSIRDIEVNIKKLKVTITTKPLLPSVLKTYVSSSEDQTFFSLCEGDAKNI